MSIWSKIFGKGASSSSKEPSPSSESAALTTISGIGPGFAKRLKSSKIKTVSELAAADPSEVSASAGVSEDRAKTWIKLAKKA
mgnify:CR=1 FL=1|jgi:predicted flap endonuclease-1-like 5' DNA nuclease